MTKDFRKLISQKAEEKYRSISNYNKNCLIKQLDTTDYLLRTSANRKSMYKILDNDTQKDSLIFNNVEELKKYVQNLTPNPSIWLTKPE